jgi:pyruvate carboxylase
VCEVKPFLTGLRFHIWKHNKAVALRHDACAIDACANAFALFNRIKTLPWLGKLIVHQATRREAIETMSRALKELRIEGIKTTVPLHLEVLANSAFHDSQVDTTFVERMLAG